MSDFKILEYGERAKCLYGIENKEITELELEALLEGKRLWTDINWEYAITIRLKDRLNESDLDRENRELKSQLQQKENIINGMEKFFQKAYDNEIKPLNDRKVSVWTICLDKLQELKGDSSNE